MSNRLGIEDLPINSDGVEDWFERLESMIDVNEVFIGAKDANEKAMRKRSLFLAAIGREGYRLLKAYVAPDLPKTKTYDQLKKCIMDNLVSKPSAVAESYKLTQLKQEPSETLAFFMSRIKLAATKCDFGDSYDRMVRDKFIHGMHSEKIRSMLINDATVTTSALALEKAMARENSDKAAHGMNTVNYVGRYHGNSNKNHGKKFSGYNILSNLIFV